MVGQKRLLLTGLLLEELLRNDYLVNIFGLLGRGQLCERYIKLATLSPCITLKPCIVDSAANILALFFVAKAYEKDFTWTSEGRKAEYVGELNEAQVAALAADAAFVAETACRKGPTPPSAHYTEWHG